MLRTRKRPLPSRRINKDEALGIAIFLAFTSVYVMAVTTSYYAALFLAFSIFFYVVIYTMWLKPRTKYNIVIGGAAGAFPPAIRHITFINVFNNFYVDPTSFLGTISLLFERL